MIEEVITLIFQDMSQAKRCKDIMINAVIDGFVFVLFS